MLPRTGLREWGMARRAALDRLALGTEQAGNTPERGLVQPSTLRSAPADGRERSWWRRTGHRQFRQAARPARPHGRSRQARP